MAQLSIDDRELCKSCWRTSPVGFDVPDEVWNAAVPEKYRTHVLCLTCFCGFADAALIRWDDDIKFWPVSLVTSREPID